MVGSGASMVSRRKVLEEEKRRVKELPMFHQELEHPMFHQGFEHPMKLQVSDPKLVPVPVLAQGC